MVEAHAWDAHISWQFEIRPRGVYLVFVLLHTNLKANPVARKSKVFSPVRIANPLIEIGYLSHLMQLSISKITVSNRQLAMHGRLCYFLVLSLCCSRVTNNETYTFPSKFK